MPTNFFLGKRKGYRWRDITIMLRELRNLWGYIGKRAGAVWESLSLQIDDIPCEAILWRRLLTGLLEIVQSRFNHDAVLGSKDRFLSLVEGRGRSFGKLLLGIWYSRNLCGFRNGHIVVAIRARKVAMVMNEKRCEYLGYRTIRGIVPLWQLLWDFGGAVTYRL